MSRFDSRTDDRNRVPHSLRRIENNDCSPLDGCGGSLLQDSRRSSCPALKPPSVTRSTRSRVLILFKWELRAHVVCQRPTDHSTRVQVNYHRQVHPTNPGQSERHLARGPGTGFSIVARPINSYLAAHPGDRVLADFGADEVKSHFFDFAKYAAALQPM